MSHLQSTEFGRVRVEKEKLSRARYSRQFHAGAHPDGYQHGGRKATETSVTEFCHKSVDLSLKEL